MISPYELVLEPAEVKARLEWARRKGHPQYLWPELEPAAWRAGLRELERLAADVLRNGSGELGGVPGARALGIAGYTSGLGPLVGHWIERGRVEAGEPLSSLFRMHLEHGRARSLRLARELERSAEALASAEVRAIVVKSAHTGSAYFPEPGARPAVDVDLVVPGADLARAEAALRGAGYGLAARQHRPPKSDWLPPGVEPFPRSLEVLHSASHYAVDLQASLDRNFFGVRTVRIAPVEEAPTRPAPELGRGLRVLRQPALLAYHALHASEGLHNLTLVRQVELVLMIRRDTASGELVWEEVAELLERTGGARFAYPALALSERLAPGMLDPAVLRLLEGQATSRMRRVVGALSPGEAQRLDTLPLRERFMWCATPADYARRLVHMAAPAPAGRSLRRLTGLYGARMYRLLRGRVTAGDGGDA